MEPEGDVREEVNRWQESDPTAEQRLYVRLKERDQTARLFLEAAFPRANLVGLDADERAGICDAAMTKLCAWVAGNELKRETNPQLPCFINASFVAQQLHWVWSNMRRGGHREQLTSDGDVEAAQDRTISLRPGALPRARAERLDVLRRWHEFSSEEQATVKLWMEGHHQRVIAEFFDTTYAAMRTRISRLIRHLRGEEQEPKAEESKEEEPK